MRVLILGTSSGAGKTTICAMLCRYYSRMGYDPVPFKASNLSNTSVRTADGGEIGIGQAFPAWSAGLEPERDMNPVILKPRGKGSVELYLYGEKRMQADLKNPIDKTTVMPEIGAALDRLASEHGLVLAEGSGSPVELNTMPRDMANTGLMRETGIPAIIVGDIERGGVFAAIYGTWRLIPDDMKHQMKGFVINRFRGDASILKDGIEEIERRTGMRCLGILPRVDLRFPEEDSLSLKSGRMEGSTEHEAYMRNVDELVDVCIGAGFDFEGLLEIARE